MSAAHSLAALSQCLSLRSALSYELERYRALNADDVARERAVRQRWAREVAQMAAGSAGWETRARAAETEVAAARAAGWEEATQEGAERELALTREIKRLRDRLTGGGGAASGTAGGEVSAATRGEVSAATRAEAARLESCLAAATAWSVATAVGGRAGPWEQMSVQELARLGEKLMIVKTTIENAIAKKRL